ncbi:MAG: type I-E CRISPR-associated protein Cas7/Cse4/CasC [Anaerolineae bacterium]|nr:type I-E CRISPR-associated protein Cas7/Cse4/CasC [Anaerolineae bacterium]
MLIQIHMLQNYAPANLNRDDTGSPKDAFFGGFKRGRISSQCLKRSIRHSVVFTEVFKEKGLLASRTKRLPSLIDAQLERLGVNEPTRKAIVARVPEIGRESKKKEKDENAPTEAAETETKQLIFLSPNEIVPLAEKLLAQYQKHGPKNWSKVKIDEITDALGQSVPRSVDVAMFGRMTTSAAFEDVQAAVQVAHSLTTSAITQEFDYFTAVDDISGESGAGMIGDVEFNSATHYKYFNVHWKQLLENLGGDSDIARQAVLALVEAAATAQPSGKQNSFAAHNLPDFILIEVSQKNLPVSYANAFLKPVRQTFDKSLMEASIASLNDYRQRLRKTYGFNGQQAYTAVNDDPLADAVVMPSLPELQNWLAQQLPE